jgi:YVTN family beta-propeller protein
MKYFKKIRNIVVVLMILLGLGSLYLYRFHSNLSDESIGGKLFIVNKASSSVTVFDLEKWKHIVDIPVAVEPHEVTALQGLKKVVVTNYGNENQIGRTLTVIDGVSNTLEKIIELGQNTKPHGITAIPNTSYVLVANDVNNSLFVVNVVSGKVVSKIKTGEYVSHFVVKHPQKHIAYVINTSSETISVINLNQKQVIQTIACGSGAHGLDINPKGNEIWVTNSFENNIYVINTNTYDYQDTIVTKSEPIRLKFSVDGKICLVSNVSSGSLSVIDCATKKQIKEITIPGNGNFIDRLIHHTPRPAGIAFHPNGKYAFVSNQNAAQVEVIDLKELNIVGSISSGGIPDGLTIIN